MGPGQIIIGDFTIKSVITNLQGIEKKTRKKIKLNSENNLKKKV